MENTYNPPMMQPIPEASYGGAFAHGWQMMKKHFVELLVVILLQMLLSIPFGFGNWFADEQSLDFSLYSLFNIAYGLLVMAPVSFGSSWVFLKAVRGESFKAWEIFYAFQNLANVILAILLTYILVIIGLVFLIVPGIIIACKLAFVPYLVTDQKMDATQAIRTSWEWTKGYGWTLFGMGIMSFFIAIAGVICLIVGVIPAAIWISCSFASLYHSVSVKRLAPKD